MNAGGVPNTCKSNETEMTKSSDKGIDCRVADG